MADVSPRTPFSDFLALDEDARKKVLAREHPLYAEHKHAWQIFLDAYEGSGGFLTGEYLWKYPREEEADFNRRKEQARYHQYAKSLVNLYVRHVLHRGVDRKAEDTRLTEWWDNVDGAGTKMTGLMRRAAHLALAMGHDGILLDKTTQPATGPSRADERARPVACLYTPIDIKDWRVVRDELVAIKFEEKVDDEDLLDTVDANTVAQYLIWTKTDGWIRVNADGELVVRGDVSSDNPNLNLVPFAVLRPEASAAHPFLGQSLLGNANLFRALFNRCSEEDNVLRDSSWSMLTVSVDKDGDVSEAKQQIGTEVGTTRAIVAKGTIDWKGPDQAVPKSIREAIEYLVQEIYRMAHVTYHRDSRDAESAEAIQLKHSELNEMLTGLAAAMQTVEEQVVRFFYAWMEATPEAAAAAFDKAKVSITYPREYFAKDLLHELEIWAEAIALDLGLTFTQRTKLRAAKTLDPDMDPTTLQTVEAEIKAQKPTPPPVPGFDADQLRERALGRLAEDDDKPDDEDAPAA